MRCEDASVRRRTGEWEGVCMSLQSRFVGYGEGESRRKNSYGDSLSLVERTADAKTSKNAV